MKGLYKVRVDDVSALADSVSDEVLAKVIAAKQEKKDRLARVNTDRAWIQTALTERGYKTLREFLVAIGELGMAGESRKNKARSVKRTRLEPAIRQKIIDSLKSGKTTKEVMSEFNIPDHTVYGIKSDNGLSKKREQMPAALATAA